MNKSNKLPADRVNILRWTVLSLIKQRTQTKLFCLHTAAVKLVALLLKFRNDRLTLNTHTLTHTHTS